MFSKIFYNFTTIQVEHRILILGTMYSILLNERCIYFLYIFPALIEILNSLLLFHINN